MDAKQGYQAERAAALKAWRVRYEGLVAQALRGSAHARLEAARLFDILHEKRYGVHRSLEELTMAGDTGWDGAKARLEAAWAALTAATDEVAARLERLTLSQETADARNDRSRARRALAAGDVVVLYDERAHPYPAGDRARGRRDPDHPGTAALELNAMLK